jgi:hypothetical protein
MMRGVGRAVSAALRLAALVAAAVGSLSPAVSADPADHAGLVAWYRIDALHRDHNDGELVLSWPDSSGRGHDLVAHPDGVRAVFVTSQLNREPVVRLRANTRFRIEQPFELRDHTIFLVYDTTVTRRALFHDGADDRRGLILLDLQRHHRLVTEERDRAASYTGRPVRSKAFAITMLTRQRGVLGCSINGVDFSSGERWSESVRVGGFFYVQPAAGGRGDADSLRVAEMIFYNRMLEAEEIDAVSSYLASKYGLPYEPVARPASASDTSEPPESSFLPPLEQVQAWLGTDSELDVNPRAVVVPWRSQIKLESPFRHELDEAANSRLSCTRDGTLAELFVRLPVKTSARETEVQLLILKNGEEYLAEQAATGPIRGANPKRAIIEHRTTLELNAGDYVQVVARGIGERGIVTIDPSRAALVLRTD